MSKFYWITVWCFIILPLTSSSNYRIKCQLASIPQDNIMVLFLMVLWKLDKMTFQISLTYQYYISFHCIEENIIKYMCVFAKYFVCLTLQRNEFAILFFKGSNISMKVDKVEYISTISLICACDNKIKEISSLKWHIFPLHETCMWNYIKKKSSYVL